ncbi:hypothetical protein DFH28DRAFT_1165121 [Melampsora americana]|nr:hypothetical protein DFH28DRAFT_1230362 [Melampsora americana]KAH9806734.1 hypothetical protein DFH28DRAFT_1165121 [Melampsora americana]
MSILMSVNFSKTYPAQEYPGVGPAQRSITSSHLTPTSTQICPFNLTHIVIHNHSLTTTDTTMVRRIRKLCSNQSNQAEPYRRKRNQKVNAEAEARFNRDVDQARRLLLGHLAPPNAVEEGHDPNMEQFLPMNGHPEQQDEEGMWVDVNVAEEFDPDGSIRRFVQKHRGYRYAQQREKLREQWALIEHQLTAAYLECQVKTLNWTNTLCWLNERSMDCQCTNFYHRNIDLIQVLGRSVAKPVQFCHCSPEAVQLVYKGYLPCSPNQPRTAISIPLLQLYHEIWLTSVTAASSFIEGVMKFHDKRSCKPMTARGTQGTRRNLGQPFSNAAHLYARFMVITQTLLQEGLEWTTIDQWAHRCPRCFGPAQHEHKESMKEPDVIICMDGNFQHRHNVLASKDNPTDDQYPSIFVPPSQIEKQKVKVVAAADAAANQAPEDPCSQAHKTANDTRDSSTWDKCDDTGLFAAACRHDVTLALANIFKSGEKMTYPLSLLNVILDENPDRKFGILYDIGCHLDKHIKLHNHLAEHHNRIMLGTSVFHAYVHTWACQLFYNPRFLEDWGLSDGEGLERLWSELSPLIARLRTSTRLHRLEAIALRCDYLGSRHLETTGVWLSRRLCKTRTTINEAQMLLDECCQEENPFDPGERYTPSFFRRQWQAERLASIASSKDIKVRQQLELGRLLCLEELAHQTWWTDVNNEGPAAERLHRVQSIAADITAQRKKVGLPECFSHLPGEAIDLLLKVWYTKTEVRTRYLALRSEQRPLDPDKKAGGGSRLGTHDKERIIIAIQKRTRTMKKYLNTYNVFAQSFQDQFPDHPTSPVIEYADLMDLEADDPFWNHGIFTHSNEPWAIDRGTQMGMRALARLQRGQEELRRLGWEVRRAMRWATDSHNHLWNVVHSLAHSPEASPAVIASFLRHNILQASSLRAKVTIAKGLLHNEFTRISELELRWHSNVLKVFMNTRAQVGDEALLDRWTSQIRRINQLRSNDFGSIKAGDFEHLMPHQELDEYEEVGIDLPDDPPEVAEDGDSEVGEDEWEDGVDEGVVMAHAAATGNGLARAAATGNGPEEPW